MAKNGGKKSSSTLGKGKVTPVQIAFLVERFLADNNYTNTIAAFRHDAFVIFAKTKSKEAPKGLMGLADILDEYIVLKEQRMSVDEEKRRVEIAFQGFNDVMRAYHSGGAISLPPSLPPPMASPPTTGTLIPATNPSSISPPGLTIHGSFVTNSAQPPSLPFGVTESNKFSTPIPNGSSAVKRKASKPAPKVPPPPKKSRNQQSTNTLKMQGVTSSAQVSSPDYTKDHIASSSVVQSTLNNSIEQSPIIGYSVAKGLFNHRPESRASSSSPKTPPQALQSQNEKSASPLEKPSLGAIDSNTSQMISSSNCSMISSERIIISPLKNKGYYAVERSYCVSSPMKPFSERMNKREQVKGRLDFDESFPQMSSEGSVATDSSPSIADEGTPGSFDFDLPDFDFLDGDLSKLLVDMDLEHERMLSCQYSSAAPNYISGLEQSTGSGCLETDPALYCCPSTVMEIISHKDMDVQGPDTSTSMRSITKCITFSSPSKGRSCSSTDFTG